MRFSDDRQWTVHVSRVLKNFGPTLVPHTCEGNKLKYYNRTQCLGGPAVPLPTKSDNILNWTSEGSRLFVIDNIAVSVSLQKHCLSLKSIYIMHDFLGAKMFCVFAPMPHFDSISF